MKITPALAKKVLKVVDAGLSEGLGVAKPGKMCIEAAVNYAMGAEHGDEPECVDNDVRDLKIHINDNIKTTPKIRAKIMRRLAIAQLGSSDVNMYRFDDLVIEALGVAYRKRVPEVDIKKFDADVAKTRKRMLAGETMLDNIDPDFYFTNDLEGATPEDCFDNFIQESPDDWVGQNLDYAAEACEIVVQVLKKLKSPGTKYLHLAPLGKAKYVKTVPAKRKKGNRKASKANR